MGHLGEVSRIMTTPWIPAGIHCDSPSMSSDTGILMMSPVNSHVVCLASIPEVPSNTYSTTTQTQTQYAQIICMAKEYGTSFRHTSRRTWHQSQACSAFPLPRRISTGRKDTDARMHARTHLACARGLTAHRKGFASYLYNSLVTADFQDLALALGAIWQRQVDDLRKLGKL